MKPILHPIFALLASVTREEFARQIAYLKEENRILRARLPDRLVATPKERRRLLKFGRKLGVQLRDLISIVSYQSFIRWIREEEAAHAEKKAASTRKPGRPRTPDDIRELVLKLARENRRGETSGSHLPNLESALQRRTAVDHKLIFRCHQSPSSPYLHHKFAPQNILTGREQRIQNPENALKGISSHRPYH